MNETVFATGSYEATYNADEAVAAAVGKGLGPRRLGLVEEVFHWRRTVHGKEVMGDIGERMTLDAVYTGADLLCRFTLKEWNPAVKALLVPWSEDLGVVGPVGERLARYAGELVLTAGPGSLAETNGPHTIRFGKVTVAPGTAVDIPLGPLPRDIELTLQCFPYQDNSGTWRWFETT